MRTKNHKLNRAVQAMLFGMVERGMDAEVVGDKGKARAAQGNTPGGEDAMWAVVLTKDLWKKGIWCVLHGFLHASISLKLLQGMTQKPSLSSPSDASTQSPRYRVLHCISSLEETKTKTTATTRIMRCVLYLCPQTGPSILETDKVFRPRVLKPCSTDGRSTKRHEAETKGYGRI